MDVSGWQKMGNLMGASAAEWVSSMAGVWGSAGMIGTPGGIGGVGAGGMNSLWALAPELAAGMYAFQLAAPLLRQFLEGLPDLGRLFPGKDSPGEVHGSRHKREAGNAQDSRNVQGEIDRILGDGSLSLEEKILLIAGLVSDSVGGQLEDLLRQQGQMAKSVDGSSTGASGAGAQFQNLENRIQVLVQRLSRMQTLSSNLLQSLHSTQRSVLANIRV